MQPSTAICDETLDAMMLRLRDSVNTKFSIANDKRRFAAQSLRCFFAVKADSDTWCVRLNVPGKQGTPATAL
jgi:hypothetical protein